MRIPTLVVAILACALATPFASAQEKATPAGPAMSMDMDGQMTRMQENMGQMRQQMERLQATTDPTERRQLMQEHMRTMQENMKSMGGMSGPMMKGDGEQGRTAMGGPGTMTAGNIGQRQEMMEKRMDMMQMMMAQMMQHDQMMESAPAR